MDEAEIFPSITIIYGATPLAFDCSCETLETDTTDPKTPPVIEAVLLPLVLELYPANPSAPYALNKNFWPAALVFELKI